MMADKLKEDTRRCYNGSFHFAAYKHAAVSHRYHIDCFIPYKKGKQLSKTAAGQNG